MPNNQIVSAVVAMGILLAVFFGDRAFGSVSGKAGEVIGEMGVRGHFDDFSRGVIDTWWFNPEKARLLATGTAPPRPATERQAKRCSPISFVVCC